MSVSVLLSSCFINDLFRPETLPDDSVSSNISEPSGLFSETESIPGETSGISSETEENRIDLSSDEIKMIQNYIENITLYENITDFNNINEIDPNWLAGRFFFIADYADPEDYDEDFEGAYIATLESVQAVVNEHVNPGIILSSDFNYELDESLVKWLPEYGLFSWFGRGLPYGFRVSYPVLAYSVNDTLYYYSIDLQEYWDYEDDENAIKEIYDEFGNTVVGTYNPVSGEFDFAVETNTLAKFRYTLIRNGEEGYYLLSKERISG